jgi:integrase
LDRLPFLAAPKGKPSFLRAAEGRRLYARFALAVGSGMRQGELLGLRWSDVNFEQGTIKVARTLGTVGNQFIVKAPKSKYSRRTINLPSFALAALQAQRHAMLKEGNITAPVFCTKTGQYISKSNLTRQVLKPILKSVSKISALPSIRFHDLRHTHATTLLARGHSIKAVSHRLGHASIDITLKTYAHVLPEDDRTLATGLDRMFG